MRATGYIAALLLLSTPHFAAAQCKIARVATVPLTVNHNRAIIPVSINETPGQFEIDTGSSETLLGNAYATRSGVGIDRRAGLYTMVGAGGKESLPGYNVHARHIQIGDLSFNDWEFAASGGDIPGPEAVDGLLGRDFLHYFDLELDFAAGHATIWRLSDCKDLQPPWKGDYDSIPLKKLRDFVLTLPIWIDNAFLDVMFDTGAPGLLLSRDAARRAGATDAQLTRDAHGDGMGIGGGFTAVHHVFDTVLVGSDVFKALGVAVDPSEYGGEGTKSYDGTDGVMGFGLVRGDRVWISFGTSALFVQRAPAPPKK